MEKGACLGAAALAPAARAPISSFTCRRIGGWSAPRGRAAAQPADGQTERHRQGDHADGAGSRLVIPGQLPVPIGEESVEEQVSHRRHWKPARHPATAQNTATAAAITASRSPLWSGANAAESIRATTIMATEPAARPNSKGMRRRPARCRTASLRMATTRSSWRTNARPKSAVRPSKRSGIPLSAALTASLRMPENS